MSEPLSRWTVSPRVCYALGYTNGLFWLANEIKVGAAQSNSSITCEANYRESDLSKLRVVLKF